MSDIITLNYTSIRDSRAILKLGTKMIHVRITLFKKYLIFATSEHWCGKIH